MNWLTRKKIFEGLTVEQDYTLDYGFEKWSHKTMLNDDERWELKRMINALAADEIGHFNRAKDLMRERGIDYRMLYKRGVPFVDPKTCRKFNKG